MYLANQIQSQNLNSAIKTSRNFVISELPKLNQQIDNGIINNSDFIEIIKPQLKFLFDSICVSSRSRKISIKDARSAIQLIGFMVSAAEKHFQAKGEEKGTALSLLHDAEETLVKLAPIAKHPPRDSAYTYWIWNSSDEPLTFTGDEQEIKFNQVINESDRVFKETCELLRPITARRISIESEKAEELLQLAASKMANLRNVFMSLMHRKDGPDSRRAMEPMFFMTQMRLYLVPYPIGGQEWEGVSAANLASQMSIDYLIGTTDDEYFHHVKGRFEYFPEEERAVLEQDMSGDSVLSVFLGALGLSYESAKEKEILFLKDLVNNQSPQLRKNLVQYKALIKASSHLTASHWSLIDNYLLKPSKHLATTSHLTVDPEKGTSGMSMSDVIQIREMRRNHAIAGNLIACV
jgi:predicted DNA-binding protein (MmcQ/YjbR family)